MKPFDCAFCGEPCTDHYREITGWEERREQGGANKIIGRKETGRYACARCIKDIELGIPPGSPSLF